MNEYKVIVKGMTCNHCAFNVRRALAECAGVGLVTVDLPRGEAVVTGGPFDVDTLCRAVEELGYRARPSDDDGGDANGETHGAP